MPAAARGDVPAAARGDVPAAARGDVIASIKVVGNQRIEAGTILSYILVQPGDPFDRDRLDRSVKTLYATGLFRDVSLDRQGSTLVVHVAENPIVDKIAFEGNHKLTDDTLKAALTLRPRAVYSPQMAEADRQKLLDLYAKQGRYAATVEPKVIRLPDNRVDVVFEINEGQITLISKIVFVGNHAFGEGALREAIDSRESRFWRIFSNADEYSPERLDFDKELIRRFYLKHGYVDVDVTDAKAELAPDKNSFILTFVINEGEPYTIGKVSIDSKVSHLDSDTLLPLVDIRPGDVYDGDAVERSGNAIQADAQDHGYAFTEVHPRIARDRAKHTVDLVFDVVQGPRVYIERIDISGNTRTEDKVIRRQFTLGEGDAFDAGSLRTSRQRLQDLGYFNSVNVTTQPGSAPDRVIVNTQVAEKATGELTVGGGYSTDAGLLGQIGLREKNLVGTGIDASINTTLAQRESQIDLSVTDPYFLDRNLVAGVDVYQIRTENLTVSDYEERRLGFSLRLGYAFNDHLSQSWTYSFVDRNVYNISSTASIYVQDEQGQSLLSQLGQTLALDYRDSRLEPHTGFITRLGTDFAGLGGDAQYVRTKLDGTYYIPLDHFTGNADWGISIAGGVGYLAELGDRERIIDRFFLGGDNLRGFADGGAGPHSLPTDTYPTADSLGGRFIYTQTTELHFPLPISQDLGITGRYFVDVGGLEGLRATALQAADQPVQTNNLSPRVGTGVGVSWHSPFGLINIDIGYPVVKQRYDQTQLFRFGFGTQF